MILETITGNLLDAYRQVQPGTMLHVDELMNERRSNKELQYQWFYTADGLIYFLDGVDKIPTLLITREAHNPVLQRIDDAFEPLIKGANYHVLEVDLKKALAAPDRVLIALPNLRFPDIEKGWGFLRIRTADGFIKTKNGYEASTEDEQKVKERFGYTSENLAMLRDSPEKIKETLVCFLNPDYVRKYAEESAIALASRLVGFNGNSSKFDATVRNIDYPGRVRGVRTNKVREGRSMQKADSPYISVFGDAYKEYMKAHIRSIIYKK